MELQIKFKFKFFIDFHHIGIYQHNSQIKPFDMCLNLFILCTQYENGIIWLPKSNPIIMLYKYLASRTRSFTQLMRVVSSTLQIVSLVESITRWFLSPACFLLVNKLRYISSCLVTGSWQRLSYCTMEAVLCCNSYNNVGIWVPRLYMPNFYFF